MLSDARALKSYENSALACGRTPSSSNDRLVNLAANLQRCSEGDLQIFAKKSHIVFRIAAKFAAAFER